MNKMKDIFVAPKHLPAKSGPGIVHSVNILSTFCKNPKEISFQTQKPGESIILFLRAHLITNISWIAMSLIAMVIPIIVLVLLQNFGEFLSNPAISRFILVYVLFYYLLVFSYIFISFLVWFYNVFIVTTERVVDIDYSDIVVHNIAITNLNNVEDANYTQSGFIPTLFNYGHLYAQTAGNEKNFEALSIPKPREATHIIGDLLGKGHPARSK